MRVLLLNQCFYPDVASTAQHLSDLALELSKRGHQVTVVASNRAYDNPALRFPRRETWNGIKIIRIPSLALGKASKLRRALTFASFLFVCALRLLVLPRADVAIALTSPPLISVFGAMFALIKRGRFIFWVMDLNPDEAVAAGWLNQDSLVARTLFSFLRFSLRHAERIIVLDRFMKQRIVDKGISEERVTIIAPWSHTDAVAFDIAGREKFRAAHGLAGKFVVMYSGNHSPCHPLDTLLGAARELSTREDVAFCFVGGGSEFEKVKRYAETNELQNILCLPYQPLEELARSLSSADLHAVVMGDAFTGIVHPCKIYNILEIGSPVLYVGPPAGHIVDVIAKLEDQESVCSVRHGDVAGLTAYISAAAAAARGKRSTSTTRVAATFSKESLLPRMMEVIERAPAQQFENRAAVAEAKEQWLS
jgi:glycosyltransferase involved in cell wall biosynthesis